MCSLTWFCDKTGYHVFFNRDEQRSRTKASPPQIFDGAQGRWIMPVDPQGGGSWISTNQYGVTIALLNFYQGQVPAGGLISRGAIVRSLALCQSYHEVVQYLRGIEHKQYAPFTLTVFCPDVFHHGRAGIIRWDGEELHDYTAAGPLISSGVAFEQVSKSRLKTYRDLIVNSKSGDRISDHTRYHQSHVPDKSAYSVCMHRDDALSVSFSHIFVNNKESVFRYADGPPCENACSYQVCLDRQAQVNIGREARET